MRAPRPAGREAVRHRTVLPRFRDAFLGVYIAYREEPNLRFQLFAGVSAMALARAVRAEPWEWAYLAMTVVLVLFAEMVNTAVERAVDLSAGGQMHPLAATAKRVAAGAVLLATAHAAAAGIGLFLVHRSPGETLSALASFLAANPWAALLPLAAGALALLAGNSAPKDR